MAEPVTAVSYRNAALFVGIPLGIYLVFIGLCSVPFFQRQFLYANAVHTLWWSDVNFPEYWGFAKNQITPFTIQTEDGQSLYAWHMLPLPLYSLHEELLIRQPSGLSEDITKTENFKLLKEDPNSRLVIYCHIAQAFRPGSYHTLTDTSSYHVLSIDYRGFGHSTGVPTEAGLILDGVAAVRWAMDTAGIPASRIVLLGQSLGTAVATGVAAHFSVAHQASSGKNVDFAGVVLVAGFSSLPTMLADYRIAGFVPALAPLRVWPWLQTRFMQRLVDTWQSAERLREMVKAVKARGGRLRLSLVHARDDRDIPYTEDDKLFVAAVNGTVEGGSEFDLQTLAEEKKRRTLVKGEDSFVTTWSDGDVIIRQELVPYGGHNDIMSYAPVTQAVMRSFDLIGTGQT